jgi:hypothetical protein
MESPNTGFQNKYDKVCQSEGTRNPRKSVLVSKVVNPFTRALGPPFIQRRRDFYIPRLPSNLKNIPHVNRYKNVFCTPWFAGLISYIYKPTTSSHFEPGLLRLVFDWVFSWPSTFDSWKPSIIKISKSSFRIHNWSESLQFSEVSIAIVSRIRYIHAVLKQQIDLRSSAHSTIVSHNLRGSVNHVRNNKTETDLRSSDSSPNIFTNSPKFHLFRSSVGERFLPKSPTPCPEDINYTPWFSNIKSNANNTPNQPCHQAKKKRCWIVSWALQKQHSVAPFHFLLAKLSLVRSTPCLKYQRKILNFKGTFASKMKHQKGLPP